MAHALLAARSPGILYIAASGAMLPDRGVSPAGAYTEGCLGRAADCLSGAVHATSVNRSLLRMPFFLLI